MDTINTRDEKKMYSIGELANYLGCSKPTIQTLKASGKIPYIQFGRKVIFDKAEITAALAIKPTTKQKAV